MQPIDELSVIRQVKAEFDKMSYEEFKKSPERLLMLFDLARNSLSPVSERATSPERNTEVAAAVTAAVRALAQTINGNRPMTDTESYDCLRGFGSTTMPPDKIFWLMDKTVKQLEAAPVAT